jgi:hypothetical protein
VLLRRLRRAEIRIAALVEREYADRKDRAQIWADRNRAEGSAALARACLLALAAAWPVEEAAEAREVGR